MGLLRRILGDPLSAKLRNTWPQLEKSWEGRNIEMPKEAGDVSNISQMGWIGKHLNPDAYAKTGMFGNISLNRELIEKDKQNLDDVLVHELAHVGQGAGGFLRKYYEPSKLEDEAINREAMRPVRREDIPLRTNNIDPNIKPKIKYIK